MEIQLFQANIILRIVLGITFCWVRREFWGHHTELTGFSLLLFLVGKKSYKRKALRCGKLPGPGGCHGVGKNSLYIMDCRDGFCRSCLSSVTDFLTSIRSDSLPPWSTESHRVRAASQWAKTPTERKVPLRIFLEQIYKFLYIWTHESNWISRNLQKRN